jgi:tetratricopeptide (TPR) repeat protein
LQGRHEEAIAEFGRVKGLENNPRYLSWLGYAYGVSGRKDDALGVLNRLGELSHQTSISPFWIASVHVGMGEKDETFKWLEKLLNEDARYGAVTLKVSPFFDTLRSDPRYADLLRRANFEP